MTIISPDAPCRVELVADLACGGGEINDAGIIQHAAHLETARLQPILELPKVFVRSAEAGAELLGRQPLVIFRCGSLLLASEEMIEVRLLLRGALENETKIESEREYAHYLHVLPSWDLDFAFLDRTWPLVGTLGETENRTV